MFKYSPSVKKCERDGQIHAKDGQINPKGKQIYVKSKQIYSERVKICGEREQTRKNNSVNKQLATNENECTNQRSPRNTPTDNLTSADELHSNEMNCRRSRVRYIRAARIMRDSRWDAHSDVLFKELNIVPFQERVKKAKAKTIFKALNGQCPTYLRDTFKLFREIHAKETRNSAHNIVLPKVKKGSGVRTFTFSAAKIWNSLPIEMKACKSYDGFCSQFKSVTLSA